jgi:hypothetical protein
MRTIIAYCSQVQSEVPLNNYTGKYEIQSTAVKLKYELTLLEF